MNIATPKHSIVNDDTIVAIASAPGRGGIGIVRISGSDAKQLASRIAGKEPKPRLAELATFRATDGEALDHGIVIYFKAPASYTGEDVVELQVHGAPVVLDALVRELVGDGARQARPGEFTERAFLNGKLDLAQAEAVADLIAARTEAAARAASRSLAGDFSRIVHKIIEDLTAERVRIEAAIDFPEEELDLPGLAQLLAALERIDTALTHLLSSARKSVVLGEGVKVVMVGEPNAGKSSLMNRLIGDDRVIVSPIPGTTRDVVTAETAIDGLPLTLVDTAGLRTSDDALEREGVARARAAIDTADQLLVVVDDSAPEPAALMLTKSAAPTTYVLNKIDLSGRESGTIDTNKIAVSALTGAGIEDLRRQIRAFAGQDLVKEAPFVARRRHLVSLDQSQAHLRSAIALLSSEKTIDLSAEELRQAANRLGEITGVVSSDELLGRIFADFCIGK